MDPSSTIAPEPVRQATEAPLLLCVEDEPAFLEMMTRELQHAGYRILGARTVEDALDHFQQEGAGISLVIADFRLRAGTALDLFARMRVLGPVPRFLICTGMIFPQARDQLQAAGLTRYLFKPFRIPELLETVRRNLEA